MTPVSEARRMQNKIHQRKWRDKKKNRIYKKKHMSSYHRERTAILWQSVLNMYGRICACCEMEDWSVLTVDHVNDDGKDHRKKNFRGAKLYKEMLKEYRPDLYQILCHNCNRLKEFYRVKAPNNSGGRKRVLGADYPPMTNEEIWF